MNRMTLLPILSILATLVMGATIQRSVTLTNFNAGELSPNMEGRADFEKYKAGSRELQNMLVRSQGPVTRRPGTKFIAEVKDSNDPARLIPFEYSTNDAYVLELGDEYIRFYRNGAQVLSGTAYEVNSPYDANDIFEVQYAQDAQTMRLVHPDYPPYKLTRNSASHTDWTLSEVNFVDGPFLDENEDESITITASATTGDVNLVADANVFDANHVGALWQITHLVDSNDISGRFWGVATIVSGDVAASDDEDGDGTYESNSVSIRVWENQEYTVTTGGDWSATFKIQRSYDSGTTWNTVKSFSYRGNGNVLYSGIEREDTALYRVRMENQTVSSHNERHGEGECDWTFATDAFFRHGVVKITDYNDANQVTGTVQTELASTDPTWRWAEGVWSDYRGWPRTIEHHEQRCFYGGSDSYPQVVWYSITANEDEDYDDFDAAVGDEADSWHYTLPGMSPIQWMVSAEYLMVGTTEGVGRLGSPDKAMSPQWPATYRLQARNGCAYQDAVAAIDAILYVERGGQKVREVTYTYAEDRYVAPDMSILAEHIGREGIVQIDFAERPDPMLWAVRGDGQLLSFTYQRKHEVLAWSRHITGQDPNDLTQWDDFESIAIIPGTSNRADGTARVDDEVWVIVNREVDSNNVRYVEQFQSLDWGDDPNYCWFVDCGLSAPGGGLTEDEGDVGDVNWTGTIDPVAWWPLETNDLTVDEMGNGNTLTNAGVVWTDVNCPNTWTLPILGSASGAGDFDGTDKMTIADASLSAGFPWKNGGTATDGVLCMWFKPDTGPANGQYMVLFEKHNCFRVSIYNDTGSYRITVSMYHTAGGGYPEGWITWPNTGPYLNRVVLGAWNHLGVVLQEDYTNCSVVLWNSTYNQLSWTSGYGGVDPKLQMNTGDVSLGSQSDGTEPFDGLIDDAMVFDWADGWTAQNYITRIQYIRNGPSTWEEPTAADPNKWTGATPLIGESVCLYADGRPIGSFTVDANGVLDVNDSYSIVIAGLNYFSILETMPLVDVETIGRPTTIKNLAIDFLETMGAHVGSDMTHSSDWTFSIDDFNTPIQPYTGYKPLMGYSPFMRGMNRQPVVYVWEWDCVPLTIRSITANMEITFE